MAWIRAQMPVLDQVFYLNMEHFAATEGKERRFICRFIHGPRVGKCMDSVPASGRKWDVGAREVVDLLLVLL